MAKKAYQYSNFRKPDLRVVMGKNYGVVNESADFLHKLFKEVNAFRILGITAISLFACVGIGAAVVSFFIEHQFVAQITRQALFSFWLVLIFEAAKTGTIFIYGLLRRYWNEDLSVSKRVMIRSFQILLFGLSFVSSLGMVAFTLDRPYLDEVRVQDKMQVQKRFADRQKQIDEQHEKNIHTLRQSHAKEFDMRFERLQARYIPLLNKNRTEYRHEMDNVIGKTFNGPRYKEFERQINRLEAEYRDALAALYQDKKSAGVRLQQTLNRQREVNAADLTRLSQEQQGALEQIKHDDYFGDPRVHNRAAAALLATLNNGCCNLFGFALKQVSFVLFFAVLIAILLEMTIYITLSSFVTFASQNMDLVHKANREAFSTKKNSSPSGGNTPEGVSA